MNILEKIKILLKIKKSIKEVETMALKEGYKSTEFWLVVVSNLVNIVGALNGVIKPDTAAIILTILNAMYAILRTLVKNPDITTIIDNSVSK